MVDRLVIREEDRTRLADSIETALRTADGVVEVALHEGDSVETLIFSEKYACPSCGVNLPELEPRQFSFNSPYGACPGCGGLGTRKEPNAELLVGDASVSILEGVVLPWGVPRGHLRTTILDGLAAALDFDLNTPWGQLSPQVREILLYGSDAAAGGAKLPKGLKWTGILRDVEQRYRDTTSDSVRAQLDEYMSTLPCTVCGGTRLRPESLAVHVADTSLGQVVEMSVQRGTRLLRSPCSRGVRSRPRSRARS